MNALKHLLLGFVMGGLFLPLFSLAQSSTPTTTSVSITPNPFPLGRPLPILVTVSGNNPTGSVCFYFDGSSQSTGCGIPLTNGRVNFTIGTGGSMTSVGSHSVNVIYSGDSVNQASSNTVNYSVIATSLSVDKASVAIGETVTFSATVPGNNPTGTVNFKSGASILNTVSLVGSSATYSTTFGRVGTYVISAVYNGDSNNLSMSSLPFSLTVTQAKTSTTTALTLNPSALKTGDSLNMTVAVSGSSPTGTVCLYFDASSQAAACAIPLVSGQLSYTATLSPTSSGAVGNHSLKVDYSGDANNQASSATAAYTVTAPNAPPSVSLTTPLNNATYVIPDNVILSANASDSDGSIAKVEFFSGTTLLATLTQAPYTFNWTNVAVGAYTITAKATDDLGASTLSAPVNMRMNGKPQTSYYIYTDHLNTPRAVSNQDGTVVWQWDNGDPFGGNVPNQDPGSTGNAFEFNFRFPGQYYDRETNLYYNYFRDYDPATGRYVQSDPIGLAGGINTYSYVGGNPISKIDSLGLAGAAVYFGGYQVDTGMGFSLPLGHAGALAIDDKTGATQYFDFGRYGGPYGDVRGPFDVGTVKFDDTGMPTQESWDAINKTMSDRYGKGTYPNSIYNGDADASKITEFALDRQKNVAKYPYTINPFSKNKFNVCDTFARDALKAGSK